jgi:hypothetical protein
MSRADKATISDCLKSIGIDPKVDFEGCESLGDEFNKIKKAYFRKILVAHPDKGGDAAEFRDVQSSWEVLRTLNDEGKIASYAVAENESIKKKYSDIYNEFSKMPTPSWDYFSTAAEEEVPTYKV